MRIIESGIKLDGHPVMDLVRSGIKKHGVDGEFVVCWGWRKGKEYADLGQKVLVFERGYLGDRLKDWTSIAWNGLNGRGDFCLPEKVDFNRFKHNFGEIKPWKKDGDLIVIMGQIVGDMSLGGKDLTVWYENIARAMALHHNKKVVFRPHPHVSHNRRNFKPNIDIFDGTLHQALDRAYMVVTYNSNAGVDAVLNGIPSYSADIGSMAYDVTSHEICDRIMPDRKDWAARLAHCQWTAQEIANGDWVKRFFNDRKA